MPFRGIWDDPRNLQGSLGEILLMHPVRPRRRSRRDQPNDRTSHGSSLLVLLLCALPVVLFVVEPAVGCPQRVPLPDRVYASPSLTQGETWHRGMSLFRNTATTSKLHPNAVAEIVSSQARPPTRHSRRFIHNTRQARTRTRFP